MSTTPRIQVDLTSAPSKRWLALRGFRTEAKKLMRAYGELPRNDKSEAALDAIERDFVQADHAAELDGVARVLGCERRLVRHANYHYDGMKLLNAPPGFACTAFATQGPSGPIHARNLDWFTDDGLLATATVLVDFHGAAAGDFTLVTWPGFVGALSGVAPGRFAITLNFVTSGEAFRPGAPLVFLLREVFETAKNFVEARALLVTRPVLSDALILLTGVRPDERVVIERTPSRAATRGPEGSEPLVVTNDYRELEFPRTSGQLGESSCGRYERATKLAPSITTIDEALAALEDDQVCMVITVQHMAMQAATGQIIVTLPRQFRHLPSLKWEGFWRRMLGRVLPGR